MAIRNYEYSVGSTDELATDVLAWMNDKDGRLRSFSIVEDPCYEWLGTRLTYNPDFSRERVALGCLRRRRRADHRAHLPPGALEQG